MEPPDWMTGIQTQTECLNESDDSPWQCALADEAGELKQGWKMLATLYVVYKCRLRDFQP